LILPFGPPNQNPVNTPPLPTPMRSTWPAYLVLLDLIIIIIIIIIMEQDSSVV
jgi:hypothetical protein